MMTERRTSRSLMLGLLLLLGLVAAACGGANEVVAEPAATGDDNAAESANDVDVYGGDFIDLNGTAVDFASFEGQPTVLWFWAPW